MARLARLLLGLTLALPLVGVLGSLEGCPSAGVATPQTFNEKLAYGYATHTAILQTATAGVTSGSLTSTDAAKVLADADSVKVGLDAAAAANAAGDVAGANSKLAIALSVLTSIQTFLNSKAHP